MNREERDIITVFTLLDMEEYYNELETAINTVIDRIPNFKNTYFLLWGESYQDVDTFETEKDAKFFLLETIRGKKNFSKYTHYTLAIGEEKLNELWNENDGKLPWDEFINEYWRKNYE